MCHGVFSVCRACFLDCTGNFKAVADVVWMRFLVCAECFNSIKTVLHLIIIWMGIFKDGLNAE